MVDSNGSGKDNRLNKHEKNDNFFNSKSCLYLHRKVNKLTSKRVNKRL
jgi:hypothetical protein